MLLIIKNLHKQIKIFSFVVYIMCVIKEYEFLDFLFNTLDLYENIFLIDFGMLRFFVLSFT